MTTMMRNEVEVFKTQMSFDVNTTKDIRFDDWVVVTKKEADFRDALQDVADKSTWKNDITTSDMEVFAIQGCAEWQEIMANKPEFLGAFSKTYEVPEEIVQDTANHTGLMLKVDDEYIPVRTSAMKSMLETAKINGNALKKMPVSNLATVLNYCLEVAKGKTLLLKRAGKASAVLSADAKGYGILPMEELFDTAKEEIENKVATLTGGRAAEEVVFGSVTTGASNDIEQATKLSRAMITRYGMSEEFDMVAMETVTNQYLGGDASLACSAETQTQIDRQVVELVKKQHEKARKILTENRQKLDELAAYLYEKETITGEEFMSILDA